MQQPMQVIILWLQDTLAMLSPSLHLATFCCTYYQLQCKLHHTTSSTDWLPKLLHCSLKLRPHSSWPQSPHLMALTCTVQLPINSLGFYSIILNMIIWVWVWGWGSYLIWETFSPRATSQGTHSCIYLKLLLPCRDGESVAKVPWSQRMMTCMGCCMEWHPGNSTRTRNQYV